VVTLRLLLHRPTTSMAPVGRAKLSPAPLSRSDNSRQRTARLGASSRGFRGSYMRGDCGSLGMIVSYPYGCKTSHPTCATSVRVRESLRDADSYNYVL